MSIVTTFVGLDYHQDSVQVCVLDSQGNQLTNRSVNNNAAVIARVATRHGRPTRPIWAMPSCWPIRHGQTTGSVLWRHSSQCQQRCAAGRRRFEQGRQSGTSQSVDRTGPPADSHARRAVGEGRPWHVGARQTKECCGRGDRQPLDAMAAPRIEERRIGWFDLDSGSTKGGRPFRLHRRGDLRRGGGRQRPALRVSVPSKTEGARRRTVQH